MAKHKVHPDQQSLPGIDPDLQQKLDFAKSPTPKSNGKIKAEVGPPNLGKPVKVQVPDFSNPNRPKSCLEVNFPIVPVNALSALEGNAGKPIYQMSKWWARRRSSVFRAMLIAAAMEAPIRKHPDGSPVLDDQNVPVPDDTEVDKAVWDVYYANHQKAGSFRNLRVLDCFMGGGTTLVEGARLGFQVAGVDLNPVAWFVVKNELANVDVGELRRFFQHVETEVKPLIQPFFATSCPRGHNGRWYKLAGADDPMDDTLMPPDFDPLTLSPEERKKFRYEGPEVIYTFWAKHAPCSKPGCGHRTPVFRSPVIAEKKLGVKYIELTCKKCKTAFHAELGSARLAPGAERVILESEGPFTELSQPFAQRLLDYAKGKKDEKKERARELYDMVESEPGLCCPHCGEFAGQYLRDVLNSHRQAATAKAIDKKHLRIEPPRNGTKHVYTYLLIDPDWIGGAAGVTDGKPLGGFIDAEHEPTSKWFHKRLANLNLIEVRGRIKLAEDTSHLGIDNLETTDVASADDVDEEDVAVEDDSGEGETEADAEDRKTYGPPRFIYLASGRRIDTRRSPIVKKATVACQRRGHPEVIIEGLRKAKHSAPLSPYAIQCFCPDCKAEARVYDGRYFAAPREDDITRLTAAFAEWEAEKANRLNGYWPKSEIPYGWQTHFWSIPDHGYTHWYRMFNPRQLLVHANLLFTIFNGDAPQPIREQALGAFQQYLRNQTMFCIWDISRDCMAPFFSNNHFVAKQLVVENCVFPSLGRGNFNSCVEKTIEGKSWCSDPWEPVLLNGKGSKSEKMKPGDPVLDDRVEIGCHSSSDLFEHETESVDLVITDPPFGDNFIYSEMANFFYAWLQLPLSKWYPEVFSLSATPFSQEAVKNVAHHEKDADDFYKMMLTGCWSEANRVLKPGGLMAFTFHHSEDTQWALVLEALFDSNFILEAIYPVTSDESKGANAEFGSKKIEYDMLHVCRKRLDAPTSVSWPKMRQWVKGELNRLRRLLDSYRANDISDADIRVILRGKALEFYSRHYGQVFTVGGEGEREVLSIRHALAGINQLLDEDSGESGDRPPAIVQPLCYQFLRLFGASPSITSDDLRKSLFGTTIRQRDLEDCGWIVEESRRVSAIPIHQRFEGIRKRPRKEMKTEIDQAHFLIGGAMPGSGVNLEQELSKDTWLVRPTVAAVLDWYAKSALDKEVRDAAGLAADILRRTREKLRDQPEVVDRQKRLFSELEDENW